MITNIFLGLILGVVITSFIILNNKINRTEFNTKFIIDVLKNIDNYCENNNKATNHLLDRLNDYLIHYKSDNNEIKHMIRDLDSATDSIYDRINTFDVDTQNLVIAEHRHTRKEISKQAKISSKINSKRKQSNNTQK